MNSAGPGQARSASDFLKPVWKEPSIATSGPHGAIVTGMVSTTVITTAVTSMRQRFIMSALELQQTTPTGCCRSRAFQRVGRTEGRDAKSRGDVQECRSHQAPAEQLAADYEPCLKAPGSADDHEGR